MTRLRTAVLGLAFLAGSASVAAAQATTPATPPSAQRQDGAPRGKHGGMKKGGRARGGALLRGIQLSAEQKTRVKEIRAKYAPQRKELATAMRPAMQEARAARQRGDSAAAKAAFDRTADTRAKARALREQEMRDIRGVLTVEQQKTFDRNLAQAQERMKQHQGRGGRRAA